LVKEIELALKNEIKVTALICSFNNWSIQLNEIIKQRLIPFVNIIEVDASRKSFIKWIYITFIQLLYKLKYKLGFKNVETLSYTIIKRGILLDQVLQKHSAKYNYIIAHNPGAFYPALKFAEKIGAKLGLDIEDYHPGESTSKVENKKMLLLMQQMLPKAEYCSFAAPLIKAETEKYIAKNGKPWVTILNGFPESEFISPVEHNNDKLKLVWFSQNITHGRGLEKLIPIVNELAENVELHLIGNLTANNRDTLIPNKNGIVIHSPVSQLQLHKMLAEFDVGLAFEPGKDENNRLAISNKIISYAQSGLFILATLTQGQKNFLENSELKYFLVDYQEYQIKDAILNLISKKKSRKFQKQEQFKNGNKYSWEQLSKPLEEIWLT
jgi:hypothetical protein